MNKCHQEILEEIKVMDKTNSKKSSHFDLNKYMGTSKHIYNLTNPQTWTILKNWVKNHKNISLEELIQLLDSLFQGEAYNERSLGGKLLEYYPKLRSQINPEALDKWLTGAQGWGEVDSLCQSTFPAKEVLNNWNEWEKMLKKFVRDKDVHKRRASLVLLCKSVRESDDERLADLAFENIDKLKMEKDILITKAISWLLRDLIKNHRSRVEVYLKDNEQVLPKIALREVKRKLLTGKK